jgi:hypothetical protein
MSKVIFYFLFLFLSVAEIDIAAQGIHSHHEAASDTNSLSHFFKKGRFYGHARSYLSGTINKGELTDYHALGVGAGIGYETPIFLKHFQVGLSGFFMFNVFSSDLSKLDPKTNQPNRYEVGLFDIEQPEDHEDLDRLEELYFKTHLSKKNSLKIGRQFPNSTFINPQDGRMRPTLIEGAVLEINEWQNLKLQAEYLWRVSPRSTVRWFTIGESVGVYPLGVDPEGKPSAYKNNVESGGVGILGAKYKLNSWNIEIWDNYFHNVLNTIQLKMEWKSEVIRNKNWLVGGQYIQQNNTGNGGNEEIEKSYLNTNKGSSVISARIGQQSEKFDWFLNGTRITAKGRYLMPREWGREPFYTFLPRERNEGFGDVSAVSLNTFFKPKKRIKVEFSGGYYHLPDVKNFELNKYGMPTYTQVNLGLTYQFDHYLKGLNALLLVVRKDEIGNTYENDRYVFNKVNLTHLNLIFNYHY